MNLRDSRQISFIETAATFVEQKLGASASKEAQAVVAEALAIRDASRAWTRETPLEDRKKATDRIFFLFHRAIQLGKEPTSPP